MLTLLHNVLDWAPLGVPASLFVITLVIFFHELGHFLVARACGVAVEIFSIGFGREIAGWTDKTGTRWKISWLPFGGYVKFLGDENAASVPDRAAIQQMSEEKRKDALQLKPLHQRALVVLAGPAANFIRRLSCSASCSPVSGQRGFPPMWVRCRRIRPPPRPGSSRATRSPPSTASPCNCGSGNCRASSSPARARRSRCRSCARGTL